MAACHKHMATVCYYSDSQPVGCRAHGGQGVTPGALRSHSFAVSLTPLVSTYSVITFLINKT